MLDIYPIGVDAINVDMANGNNLEEELDKRVYFFKNIDEMKSDTFISLKMSCNTLGYYTSNDGGGAEYVIVDDNDLIANDGDIIDLENGLKAKMIIKDSVNVKQFGARGDGFTDDTAAIQLALDKSHNIFFPDGIYMINAYNASWGHLTEGGILPQSNTKIILSENATLKAITNSNAFYNILNLNKVSNVTVCGGKIQGEKNSHTAQGGEWGFGIRISECKNVIIDNIEIFDCWGDGIITDSTDGLTGECNNIKITNCVIHDCRRQGISVVIGSDVVIDKCEIYNISGTAPESGIDIESNGRQDVYNIRITNCYIHDTKLDSIVFANDFTKNVTVSNCQLKSINVYGGEEYKINNCSITYGIRIAGDKTLIDNCFLRNVSIQGGNAQFSNCLFERESSDQYSNIITSGNDNYQKKAYDKVSFDNCEFRIKTNYLFFQSAQLNFNQNSTLKFNNCDFYIQGENSNFCNQISPIFILNNCKIHSTRQLWNVFTLLGSKNANFIMKNTQIQVPSKSSYLLTLSSSGKVLIDIENCKINGYSNFLYVTQSDLAGDVFLYNNLMNASVMSSIINNSVIVKHENNNIQYE